MADKFNIYRYDWMLYEYKDVVIDFFKTYKDIYIYGVGYYGDYIYKLLVHNGLEIKGFWVSDIKKKDMVLHGCKVEQFCGCKRDDGIIISTFQKEESSKILNNIIEHGVNKEQVFIWNSCEYIASPKCNFLRGISDVGQYFAKYELLNNIGNKCGTDKASSSHNYLHKYEFFLKRWKEESISLCELGIYKGQSLQMWLEYFDNAHIIGVDIDKDCKRYESYDQRCNVLIHDMSKTEEIYELSREIDGVTIIIDDASHIWSHQIKSLIILFKVLRNGGIYILEDLGTSFGKFIGTKYNDAIISGYDFCALLSQAVCGGAVDDKVIEKSLGIENEIKELAASIEMISFINESCILIKK